MTIGRILFADNIERFLNTRSEFLEHLGYEVIKATTLEDAEHHLRNTWIHLAILDIRLVDDDDENDISGILLAQNPEFQSIPKIISTGFPSWETVREALTPQVEGLPPAVIFLSKQDGADGLVKAVEKVFIQYVKINWDLEIHWRERERLSFLHLANLVYPDLSGNPLMQRSEELKDLFREIFFDYKKIWIGKLLWHDHDRFCIWVVIQSAKDTIESRVLICGDKQDTKHGWDNAKKYAPNKSDGIRPIDTINTTHFGAIIYALSSTDNETVQTLRDLFQLSKDRPLKIAFSHLLENVLASWHQLGQTVQNKNDLMAIYRTWAELKNVSQKDAKAHVDTLINLMRTLEGFEIEYDPQFITFHFPYQISRSFPDPVTSTFQPLAGSDTSVVCRMSPGKLTADNILIDAKNQNTWLTDFSYAEQAPQWWDFANLEAMIRFDLSQAEDLLAWQDFEKCLENATRLDQRLEPNDVIPELKTSLSLIEIIRRQANSETGTDIQPYEACLLVCAIRSLLTYNPNELYTQADKLHLVHILFAASILAERLTKKINTPKPTGKFTLDDNGHVRIGDHLITTLSGGRGNILKCLYDRAGEIVNLQTIVETAYHEKYDHLDRSQHQRVRQEIRRLREEIEPNPARPTYILTERGRGYRLQIE